jgi:hypothetical protein
VAQKRDLHNRGAEPGIEFDPAVQQADALLFGSTNPPPRYIKKFSICYTPPVAKKVIRYIERKGERQPF